MAMSKHFGLRKKIDDIISTLKDDGFLAELEARWFASRVLDCPAQDPVIAPSFAYVRRYNLIPHRFHMLLISAGKAEGNTHLYFTT